MKRAGRVLKTMAVASSLLMSVAVMGLWGRSYWAMQQIQEIRYSEIGGKTLLELRAISIAYGSIAVIRISQPVWSEAIADPGLSVREVKLDASGWKVIARELCRFGYDPVGLSKFPGTTELWITFPVWAVLFVVSFPAQVGMFRLVRARRVKRRIGFPVGDDERRSAP